jgi:hypothetical protein
VTGTTRCTLAPSVMVEQMWHQHLLDARNYPHDCHLLCGGTYVGHDPDGGSKEAEDEDEARKNRWEAPDWPFLLEHTDKMEGRGGGHYNIHSLYCTNYCTVGFRFGIRPWYSSSSRFRGTRVPVELDPVRPFHGNKKTEQRCDRPILFFRY